MIIEPLSLDAKNFIKVFWNLTNTCNYNCDYCNPKYKNGTFKWIDNNNYYAFIDSWILEYIYYNIFFYTLYYQYYKDNNY